MNRTLFAYYQFKAFCTVLTCSRLINSIKLVTSYVLSRVIRKPVVFAQPLALSVEPAGFCNLHCPECPTGAAVLTRAGGMMSYKLFTNAMDELSLHLMHINLFFQGEPTLNPSLGAMISYVSAKNIYTLVSTNGQRFSNKDAEEMVSGGLKEIIFSVDGLTQETYEIYRVGGRLDRLIDSVGLLVDEKKRQKSVYPLITLQFIVFAHNQHEVVRLKSFSPRLRADRYVVKTAQFNEFGDGSVAPPTEQRWQRYKDGKKFRRTIYQHCWRQWSSCVLGWDGNIVPCCYDKNSDYTFGNLTRQPLATIWKNEMAIDFRHKVLNDKYSLPICKNCPEGRGCL